jgi:lipopolysaccharide/colanic/teichoic acid biosynthesis glycosyltransferase
MIKRLFDIAAAVAGLLLVSPVLLVAAIAVKLDSEGPVFFVQKRIGRHFRPFSILKLRSMTNDQATDSRQLTVGGDARVTRVGRILRKTKIDELPQLVNVLRGEMSIVGPRPEVHKYVEMFRSDYEEILTVRPGITDLASIRYRDEEGVLAAAVDPERVYVERVLPEKIRLAKEYVRRSSLGFDLHLVMLTLVRIVSPG